MLITVTGLPRSGTAFVSMLLNLNEFCVAYHELAVYDKNWRERLTLYETAYVGDCSTYGFLEKAQMASDVRIYIASDVVQSFESATVACRKELDIDAMYKLRDMADEWAVEHEAMVINRYDVFTLEGCREIWKTCFEEPMHDEKVEQLIKLNIQHHEPHIRFGKGTVLEL